MVSDTGIVTRDYFELPEISTGSRIYVTGDFQFHSTETNPNLETSVGSLEIFVRFTMSDIDYEVGSYPSFYYKVRLETEVVVIAREFILANACDEILEQVVPYLDAIDAMGEPLISMNLPPLGVSIPEENTILIEWVLPRLRIGLYFEYAPEESSWYILSRNTDKELNAWGYLSTTGTEELTALILDQVFEFA